MTTDVEVCNLALDMAGAKALIGSLTDTNASARACNRWYALTVSEMFAAAQWNFGYSVQALALLKTASGGAWVGTDPPPAWIYEYAMPADTGRAMFVIPQGVYADAVFASTQMGLWPAYNSFSVPFKVGKGASGAVVLTNAPSALLIYIVESSEAFWPATFIKAVAARLASNLAIPLGADRQLAVTNYQLSERLLATAQAEDANNGLTVQNVPTDWIEARA
jgi:hypothetical protein